MVARIKAVQEIAVTNGVLKLELPQALDPSKMKIAAPLIKGFKVEAEKAGDTSILYIQGLDIPAGKSRVISIKVSQS